MSKIKYGGFSAKHHQRSNSKGKGKGKGGVFAPNPFSLSVPEPEFESWLRDSGYLEIIDERTTDLHRLPKPSNSNSNSIAPIGVSYVSQLFSRIWTLLSLLTINPFAKLSTEDFSGDTPAWTLGFFGSLESYSFPSSPSQARLRVQENVKRFGRNYASLLVIFFACSLYQLPFALIGITLCLALWEVFRLGGHRWGLDAHAYPPLLTQILIRLAQSAAAVILFISNVQLAIFSALAVSYAVMVFHAAFRKLAS